MNVLVGCEFSGKVRDEFRKRRHNAYSCDFLPSEDMEYHLQGDVLDYLDYPWDLAIFHPPCTYLCASGLHWNHRTPGRSEKTEEALEFVKTLLNLPIPKIALENPVGCISTRLRKWDEMIQPYHFGDDASKATCLWLKGLPPLMPTVFASPRIVLYKGKLVERWSNQTDSGQNILGPSADRWAERSVTYSGIAKAMAEQWGVA